MSNVVFSHFYSFDNLPDSMLMPVFAEFRDNGVENLVFTDNMCKRILNDHLFFYKLKLACHRTGIKLQEMHAPFGESYDLACASSGRREGLVKDHITCMQYAADCGCLTYTLHMGAFDSAYLGTPNSEIRPRALSALEQLIPTAEKLGVVIALENSFERSNTPDEAMYYVEAVNHPNVGSCLDVGHANVMAPAAWKTQEKFPAHMRNVWGGEVQFFENAFERMASGIVTCHLHDNDGFSDQHQLPGCGTVDWDDVISKLRNKAPRLLSIQSEVNTFASGVSIRRLCETFRKLFPDLA